MNHISINHVLDINAYNRQAMVLLLLGLSVFIAAFIYLRQMTTASELLKVQLERQALSKMAGATPYNTVLDAKKLAELSAVNKAIDDILLPWPQLFKALEQATQNDVKLLMVEPKVQDRSVRITAITFGVENMHAYIRRLNEQHVLKPVNLVSTESVEVNGMTSMQFELNVGW